jgi:Putative transposase, YhgA-like
MAKLKHLSSKRNKDHDIFVRGIFGFKELVLKILQYAIPEELKLFIDFSTLKNLSDAHVDETLSITYSDTIYEALLNKDVLAEHIRNDPRLPQFQFCFLGEFKSSKPLEPIDFQIEDYVKSIQRNDLKNGRPPSIVVPILIYHGKTKWEEKRLHDTFAKYLPETILAYIASPKYIVIDLQAMSDDDIKRAIDLGELRGAFTALKHAHDKKFFEQNLKEILNFVRISPPTLLFQTYLKMLMEYSQRRSGLDDKEFNTIVEQLKPDSDMATAFKTIFEVAEEKAEKKGIQKGIKEGIKEGIVIGEAKANQKVEKAIKLLIQTTDLTDAQIAHEMEVDETLVSAIRQTYFKDKK